jgi:hypothetical protein
LSRVGAVDVKGRGDGAFVDSRAVVCKPCLMDGATTPQAQPVDGRRFPTKARGARPTFFDDEGATDAVVSIVTALAAEVWALHERVASLEAVLEREGVVGSGAVESYRPQGEEAEASAAAAKAFTARVFRVFEEMREEVVAGETSQSYEAVVARAYDEVRKPEEE